MAGAFGPASSTDDVLAGISLAGKRMLVTGVSSGLGHETARALAAHGAEVVGTVRDVAQAAEALREAKDQAVANGGTIELRELDLASLSSVRDLAHDFLVDGRPFDLVIANAGVMATPFTRTVDGFELQFGTNYLGHFVLVNRIASLMRQGSRLVNISSSGHRFSDVDLGDPNFELTPYDPYVAYGRSKTALVLFAVEFDRRHKGSGVRAAAVHPGAIISTRLARYQSQKQLQALVERMNVDNRKKGSPFQWKTVAQGAATGVWAGVVADAEEVGGHYCENCHVTTRVTDEPLSIDDEGARPYALDGEHAKALWFKSEEMVGERFSGAGMEAMAGAMT